MEHCQFETVGVCTLIDRTKEEQSDGAGEGGTNAHKLTCWWAKVIVYDYSFIKQKWA